MAQQEVAAPTEYVTLSSSDGFKFVVKRSAAIVNQTIRSMLDISRGFSESLNNECHFENITGDVLEVVARYFYHAEKYKDTKDPPDLDIPLELVLEVLLASEYLNL